MSHTGKTRRVIISVSSCDFVRLSDGAKERIRRGVGKFFRNPEGSVAHAREAVQVHLATYPDAPVLDGIDVGPGVEVVWGSPPCRVFAGKRSGGAS
jgi:hypothetical protein